MRVALFGGSFNPPHIGHQLLSLYVLETEPVDELWLVPCWKHSFDKTLAPFEHRRQMCERAAAALGPRARVSDIESRMGNEKSRTLLTIKALRAAHPSVEFSLVVGADLVPELDAWYGAEELKRTVPIIVVGRGGFAGGTGVAMPTVSSSEIRSRLGRGDSVQGLVPLSVLEYLEQHRLY
jgi:nicotinate-nucleotide adenylyltransferase